VCKQIIRLHVLDDGILYEIFHTFPSTQRPPENDKCVTVVTKSCHMYLFYNMEQLPNLNKDTEDGLLKDLFTVWHLHRKTLLCCQ